MEQNKTASAFIKISEYKKIIRKPSFLFHWNPVSSKTEETVRTQLRTGKK